MNKDLNKNNCCKVIDKNSGYIIHNIWGYDTLAHGELRDCVTILLNDTSLEQYESTNYIATRYSEQEFEYIIQQINSYINFQKNLSKTYYQ